MDILLRKKAPPKIFLKQPKRIAHDYFSVCLLKNKSFYHHLIFIKCIRTTLCLFGRSGGDGYLESDF